MSGNDSVQQSGVRNGSKGSESRLPCIIPQLQRTYDGSGIPFNLFDVGSNGVGDKT